MKRTTTVILLAIASLMLILLSCTLPIYVVTTAPTEEEKDITETPTLTPTVTETPTPTSTPTYAVTPTVIVNLDGPWTIWQGTSQQRLDINFLQKGFSLVGNAATGDGQSLFFNGDISYDGTNVTGIWESTSGVSGNFVMYLDGSYATFSGNLGGGVPFCGNRLNASKPAPCLK
jgi:ABC-type glycerol-3-phosphate transport system permease component